VPLSGACNSSMSCGATPYDPAPLSAARTLDLSEEPLWIAGIREYGARRSKTAQVGILPCRCTTLGDVQARCLQFRLMLHFSQELSVGWIWTLGDRGALAI